MKTNIITTQRELNRATFEHYKPLLQSILAGIIGAVIGAVCAYYFNLNLTMKTHNVSIGDPEMVRAIADDPRFQSIELFAVEPNGHKYKVGETRTLTGLVDYSEYNGQQVEITAIREDGKHGKAYYIKGEINHLINWVYEYRLI